MPPRAQFRGPPPHREALSLVLRPGRQCTNANAFVFQHVSSCKCPHVTCFYSFQICKFSSYELNVTFLLMTAHDVYHVRYKVITQRRLLHWRPYTICCKAAFQKKKMVVKTFLLPSKITSSACRKIHRKI